MGVLRRMGPPLSAVALALLAAAPAVAAPAGDWSLSPTSVTVVLGVPTTMQFVATNLTDPAVAGPQPIGCVKLSGNNGVFAPKSAMVSDPRDGSWSAEVKGATVLVHAATDADRLSFRESVVFTVTMTPQRSGSFSLTGSAQAAATCGGGTVGASIRVDVTVLTTATPSPTPSSTPSAVPTPAPTPTTAPVSTVPPLPSAAPSRPPAPTRSPSATVSAARRPNQGRQPIVGPGAAPGPTSGGSASPSTGPEDNAVIVPDSPQRPGQDATPAMVDARVGFGEVAWTVPAALVSGPGLAVIAWVGLQAAGGVFWIPIVQRFRRSGRGRRYRGDTGGAGAAS